MKSFKTCINGLWVMSRRSAPLNAAVVLAGVVRIAASLGFVWVCKSLVDIATGVSAEPLDRGIIAMVLVMLLQILCGIAVNYLTSLNTVRTQNSLREEFFSHVLRSRWHGKEEFRSGDTINRLEEDIRVLTELICSVMPGVIVTVVQLVAASVYMLCLAPQLLWLLALLMVVAIVFSKMFFRQMRHLTKEIRAEDSEVQQLIQENLQNRVLVLTLFGIGNVMSKLSFMQSDLEDKTVKRLNYNAVARGFMNLGFAGGYLAAFVWGVVGILHGTVTYGMMTSFLQLVGQVQGPIANLSSQIPSFIKALTSVERLMELSDLETETPAGDILFEGAAGAKVEDVTFAYEGTDILEHFSYDFKPGTVTVIAGPTGVGKSTLTRLLLGLLRPCDGSVAIYGSDGTSHVADIDTRCNFMYVPQGNSLLSGTIRENMLLSNPSATEDDIRRALHTAAADFVFSLDKGLDTVCGEQGTGLSEGQCQRIAVARALLHRGGIMILDEATSALDMDTEEALLSGIKESCKGSKTVIFISHRPAAMKIADDCLFLQGKTDLKDAH